MTPPTLTDRIVLLAYPRAFRAEYGDELIRTIRDLQFHSGFGRARLAVTVARDVALTAPRLRMETIMTSPSSALIASLAALVVGGAATGLSPFMLLILAPLALLAYLGAHHDRPIRESIQGEDWWRWTGAGAAILGLTILAEGAGPNFDWFPWLGLWIIVMTALALVVMGIVLGVIHAVTILRRATRGRPVS